MNVKHLLSCLFLLSASLSFGQSVDRLKLDSLFNALAQHKLGMGSIAVAQNGKIVYSKAFGSAVVEAGRELPADDKTAYRIGSVTKLFTAVMIFQLVEEKKLSLDDSLSQYFPPLPNAGKITIRTMLYHRSGLPNFTNGTDFQQWMEQPKTHEELLAMIANQPPDFEPNAKADYNNSNFLLLGYILEKIEGKPYKEILQQRILDKLQLRHTGYAKAGNDKQPVALSYAWFDNQWKKDKAAWLDNFGGAGAIVSIPADMAIFINALFTNKLISKASLQTMTTLVDDYGMGIFPYAYRSNKGFGHNGKTEGFESSLSYYPADKLVIAYCTNGGPYPKDYILDAVKQVLADASYKVPSFKAITLRPEDLQQYAGTYAANNPPITVVSTVNNGSLVFEAMGRSFTTEALGNHLFINRPFGFLFLFSPANRQLIIMERGNSYYLKAKQ